MFDVCYFTNCRWDIADKMHMKLDDPMFLKILKDLPTDTQWDLSNPCEKSLHDAGELRYNLMKKDFDKMQALEGESEENVKMKEAKMKGEVLSLGGGAYVSNDVPIKVEFPEWLALQVKVGDMQALEGKLQTQHNELRRLLSQCNAMGTADSLKRKAECLGSTTALEPILEKLTDLCMKHKYMKDKTDLTGVASMEVAMDKLIKEASDFSAASKERCKRIRAWIELQ